MSNSAQSGATLEFPALFQAADAASIDAQNSYANIVKADLICVVLGTLLSTLSTTDLDIQTWLAVLGAILFVIAFFLSLALKFTRFERTWYGARAVAESVKSLSWKYITGAKPFRYSTSADMEFTNRLSQMLMEKKNLAYDFGADANQKDQITQSMRDMRAAAFETRKRTYLQERIAKQRIWYANKANTCRQNEKVYFRWALAGQFAGLVAALILIKYPSVPNLTGVFSSIAVALFTWMQIRKFQELAQAYALTAQELGLVEAQASQVNTDEELSDFVDSAETAISREHTMWIARREI